jgi:hypothetical protein
MKKVVFLGLTRNLCDLKFGTFWLWKLVVGSSFDSRESEKRWGFSEKSVFTPLGHKILEPPFFTVRKYDLDIIAAFRGSIPGKIVVSA